MKYEVLYKNAKSNWMQSKTVEAESAIQALKTTKSPPDRQI